MKQYKVSYRACEVEEGIITVEANSKKEVKEIVKANFSKELYGWDVKVIFRDIELVK